MGGINSSQSMLTHHQHYLSLENISESMERFPIDRGDRSGGAGGIVCARKNSLTSTGGSCTSHIKCLPTPSLRLCKYVATLHPATTQPLLQQAPVVGSSSTTDNAHSTNVHNEEMRLFKSVISLWDKKVEIRPVHCSLLACTADQPKYCFRITQPPVRRSISNHVGLALSQAQNIAQPVGTSRYYGTYSLRDRDLWINIFKQALNVDQMDDKRIDNSLHLCIQELKGAASKKKYYCEIFLDKSLQARTCIKTMTDMLLWAEAIDLRDVPKSEYLIIHLRIAGDPKKRKERSDPIVGTLSISISDLTERDLDQWHSLSLGNNNRNSKMISLQEHPTALNDSSSRVNNNGQFPMLRLRARWQSVRILPHSCYTQLRKYFSDHALDIIKALEQAGVSVAPKIQEELSRHLVKLLHYDGRVVHFLLNIIQWELSKQKEETLLLRGNSMASKSMETYLSLLADQYLKDTLSEFIQQVLQSKEDCEVDPSRMTSPNQLEPHKATLKQLVESVWMKIRANHHRLPKELRDVFIKLRHSMESQPSRDQEVLKKNRRTCFRAISACLFLRLICPAIMSPSLFGLIDQYPDDPRINRTLTLVAKVMQTLANENLFGQKEVYLVFLNPLLQHNMTNMRNFLDSISAPLPEMLFGRASESDPPTTAGEKNKLTRNGRGGGGSFKITTFLGAEDANQHKRPRAPLVDISEDDGVLLTSRIDISYELASIHTHMRILLKDIPPERLNPTLRGLQGILNDLDQCHKENHSHNPPVKTTIPFVPFSSANIKTTATLSQSLSQPTLPIHDYDDPYIDRLGSHASMASLVEEVYSSNEKLTTSTSKTHLSQANKISQNNILNRPDRFIRPSLPVSAYAIHDVPSRMQPPQPLYRESMSTPSDELDVFTSPGDANTKSWDWIDFHRQTDELRADNLRRESELKVLRDRFLEINIDNLTYVKQLRTLANKNVVDLKPHMARIMQCETRAKQGLRGDAGQ